MSPSVLVLASPGIRRRRLIYLDRHPGALDGRFGPGAEIVGQPVGPGIDADVGVPLLVAEQLAGMDEPAVALVPSRTRELAVDWCRGERYTLVPQRYVALLANVRGERGAVPLWLQRLVLHQLFAYFRADSGLYTTTAALGPALTEPFHDAVRALMADIDDELITGRVAREVSDEIRLALLLGARRRSGHSRPQTRRDAGRGLVRLSYLFAGDVPAERFVVDGTRVTPGHHKIRAIDVFGRTLLHERIAWLPDRAQVDVDSTGEVSLSARPARRIARYRRIAAENRGILGRVAADLRIRRIARGRDAVRRYRDAWLLMDRDSAAQDNAEHLYRYLSANEPDVNAWFVLGADSPDRERLRGEGFRLVEHGSSQHLVALLHCAHLVSSQVDSYVVKPLRKHLLGPPGWRFTFLQHGVIKDDLSRWLNGKPIDLFITSTPDEQCSIVGDGTPYVFTDLEVVMTGLARHDRLLAIAAAHQPTRLVIMPTWRRELLGAQGAGNERELLATFWASDYAVGWRRLLESDRLRTLCERVDWQLSFVPHPNMQDYLDASPLPAHISALRFSDIDVQETLAGAAVVVTDYSSLASEAAYIERPVVYYQFDRAAFFAGGHIYRRGAWSYEQQGFGPVTDTVDATLDELERIARDGLDPHYAARMQTAFPYRDGRCCERIVAAIRTIGSRVE